jgi:peroxiredoxin Q/BCP
MPPTRAPSLSRNLARKLAKPAPKKAAKPTDTRVQRAPAAKAPSFDLESDEGKRVRSAELAGKWYVIYFYPKDSTPGCTREAQGFTAALPALKKLGAQVFGVSKDSIASHCNFREKYDLALPLLSDPDLKVHKAFGAFGKKTMYGREVEGTIRSTFLVGPDGTIARAWRSVKVDGHVDAVVKTLQEAKG